MRDARNSDTYVGSLVTEVLALGEERYKVTKVVADDPRPRQATPHLYEATLVGFAPIAFRLRGFERIEEPDGARSFLQEWHVEGA